MIFLCAILGLFNVANKILVSLDILFLIREHVKQGVVPSHAVEAIMSMTLAKSPAAAQKINGEKRRYSYSYKYCVNPLSSPALKSLPLFERKIIFHPSPSLKHLNKILHV